MCIYVSTVGYYCTQIIKAVKSCIFIVTPLHSIFILHSKIIINITITLSIFYGSHSSLLFGTFIFLIN